MDCEKLEAVLLDELYDELDEVTSAAAKRHLAGCARCSALLNGFRATRRVAVVPRVDPPFDLEERILAAARNVQTVVPLKRRVGGAISWAGSWAMRPQTAMAAVFLLMIGSSLLFLRGKSRSPASAMHVTEEGAPAPATSAAPEHASDEPAPPSPVAAAEMKAERKGALAANSASLDDSKDSPKKKDSEKARERGEGEIVAMETATNAAVPAGAPGAPAFGLPQEPAKPSAQAAPTADLLNLGSSGGGAGGAMFADKAASRRAGAGDGVLQGTGDTFGTAMGAYQRGAYDEALQGFDRLGGSDVNAALWAARSARNGSAKCPGAVARFDDVARRAPGTITGWDALLEGGQCYRLTGQSDAARIRLTQLLTVPSHADRARRELQFLGTGSTPANGRAAPKAAATSE